MSLKELLAGVPGVRSRYAVGAALGILGSLALVAWTFALARSIANVFAQQPTTLALFGLFGFLVLRAAFRYSSSQLLASASARLRAGLRTSLVSRWCGQSERSTSTGADSTLLGPGIDSLDDYLTKFLPARLAATVVPIVVFLTVAVLDPWTTLILLFAGPMLILLLAVIGSRTRTLADQRFRELGWLRSFYLDMVRGIPTLKVFGRAQESIETIEDLSDRFGRTTMSVLRTAFQTSLVIEWAATAATALVAVQVSFRMVDGKIGFATALTVLMLTPEFFAPLRNLAVEYHAGQTGNAVLDQLSAIDSGASSTKPKALTVASIPPGAPTLEFHEVCYAYPGSNQTVLDRVSFTIHAGETVVLLGPSGAGKSTILELVQGLRSPSSGHVTINDVPIEQLDQAEWLKYLTTVPQQPFLFSSSVHDNVSISNRDASLNQVRDAIAIACATDVISALPDDIETMLSEEGVNLSGGQRQRLALARALLRPAPVVLLDEFTAHLDPALEREVISALRPFLADRTVLIAAHREATLPLADRVLRLSEGRVIEVTS